MKRFDITAHVTISVCKVIYAESEADARDIAAELQMPNLCIGCTEDKEECWHVDELDGEPDITSIKER